MVCRLAKKPFQGPPDLKLPGGRMKELSKKQVLTQTAPVPHPVQSGRHLEA